MSHPLLGDLSSQSTDELSKNLSSLQKKLSSAMRLGYFDAIQQLRLLISDYQNEVNNRHSKALEDTLKDGPDLDSFIDIG